MCLCRALSVDFVIVSRRVSIRMLLRSGRISAEIRAVPTRCRGCRWAGQGAGSKSCKKLHKLSMEVVRNIGAEKDGNQLVGAMPRGITRSVFPQMDEQLRDGMRGVPAMITSPEVIDGLGAGQGHGAHA